MNCICYIISILAIFILFLILKKSENKIDILPSVIVTFMCLLAYQVVICLLFSVITIPITLVNLSICNVIFSMLLIFYLKKKGLQKFSITKTDIIVTFVIMLVASFIIYKDVGNLERIRYYSTDASIHYISAREFYENDKMLNQTQETETSKQMIPIAYINVGILFKAFEPFVGEMNFYKIFLLFDSIIFCFSGILFYFIIKEKVNKKWQIVLGTIITIIYLIGYPLNNLLNGFYYLGIGCLMISSIIYIMTYLNNNILCNFLLNTGVIFSYTLFAPVVYLAIFLWEGYNNYKENHKILTKQFIINTIITLVIPGIMAIIFFILPNAKIVKELANEGYIHKYLIINTIFFFPFAIYFIFEKIKEKKLDFKLLYFFILITYMVLIYICTKINIISEYYFYKNVYIFWEILILFFFYGIVEWIEKNKKYSVVATIYCMIYIIGLAITIISQKNIIIFYDIYFNNNVFIQEKENLTQDDIAMLTYIKENELLSKEENNILFIGDFMQEAWIRSILKYCNRYPLEDANHWEYIRKWNQGEIPYLICFENSDTYKTVKNGCHLENANLLYATEHAKIYEH